MCADASVISYFLIPTTLSRGMTPAYGGVLSALDIRYTLTPLEVDRTIAGTPAASLARHKKYVEKETIHAIYPHKRQHIVTAKREITLDD